MVLEEEIWRLQEENDKKEQTIVELRESEERRRRPLEEELKRREEEVEELKKEQLLLEQKVQMLTGRSWAFKCHTAWKSVWTACCDVYTEVVFCLFLYFCPSLLQVWTSVRTVTLCSRLWSRSREKLPG